MCWMVAWYCDKTLEKLMRRIEYYSINILTDQRSITFFAASISVHNVTLNWICLVSNASSVIQRQRIQNKAVYMHCSKVPIVYAARYLLFSGYACAFSKVQTCANADDWGWTVSVHIQLKSVWLNHQTPWILLNVTYIHKNSSNMYLWAPQHEMCRVTLYDGTYAVHIQGSSKQNLWPRSSFF